VRPLGIAHRTAGPITTCLLAFAVAAPAAAGLAYRVKDLNPAPPAPTSRGFALIPMASTTLATGTVAFASGTPGIPGDEGEPWITDGTGAGARMLRDLWPGPTESTVIQAAAVAGGFFFVATSPGTGAELWWTDGTTAGTRLTRDIHPGRADSSPGLLGVVAGRLFFSADDGAHGNELWTSDGTSAGTFLVADLAPGPKSSGPGPAALFDGELYFAVDDGAHGRELWRTQGASGGGPVTVELVADLVPGSNGGDPADFRTAGGLLFFSAQDPVHGRELWATDGTSAGTALVADVAPGVAGSGLQLLGAVPGALVFAADDGVHGTALWASDGSAAGTAQIGAVRPANEDPEAPLEAAELGGRVIFAGYDAVHGLEPWATDGTPAGTVLLADIGPGGWDSAPTGFGRVGGEVYFGALEDGLQEGWLWKTDGTPGGTVALADVGASDEGLRVSPARAAGTGAVLWVDRFYVPGPYVAESEELWFTDGSASGTTPVVASVESRSSSDPYRLTARAEGIVFDAFDGQIFASDGTEAGTHELAYTEPGPLWDLHESALLPDGELVFGAIDDQLGTGLFRTDGDVASPVEFLDNGFPDGVVRSGDLAFFAHRIPGATELWVSDGTAGGTDVLRTVPNVFGLADVFGTAWFRSPRSQLESSLWESSGTTMTTIEHPLTGISFVDWRPLAIEPLDPVRGDFAFQAADGLHRFDPVTGAAPLFKALSRPSNGDDLAVMDGRLYFFNEGTNGNCTLWRSDGTAAGTTNVKTWSTGGCFASQMVAMGGDVYFDACSVAAGCELWRSDGTTAGTILVKDIDPGVFSSTPAALTVAGDRLYFVACDAAAGCEPWVSDGTAAGTHRVADVDPGPESSLPPVFEGYQDPYTANLAVWNRLVFLAADDGTGTELWAAPIEIFYDGFETGDLSRWVVSEEGRSRTRASR
jgi:ELWxxDGT repeat protein